jgi:hypothetical protein
MVRTMPFPAEGASTIVLVNVRHEPWQRIANARGGCTVAVSSLAPSNHQSAAFVFFRLQFVL